MSPVNESRVSCEILPVAQRLSRACFFFVAISYSSFNRFNVYFHEINYLTPHASIVKTEITFVNMVVYTWLISQMYRAENRRFYSKNGSDIQCFIYINNAIFLERQGCSLIVSCQYLFCRVHPI